MPLFKGCGCKGKPGKAIDYITDEKKAAIVTSYALDDKPIRGSKLGKAYTKEATLSIAFARHKLPMIGTPPIIATPCGRSP